MSIITKSDVKTFLNISTSTDDTLLDTLIACAEADAIANVGRCISTAASTYLEYYNGDGTPRLLLKNYPIQSVQHLYDDTDRLYAADSEIAAADFTIHGDQGIIELDRGFLFAEGNQNIKVQYTAGFATVQQDIKLALIKLVMAEYLSIKTRMNTVKDDEIGSKVKLLREDAEKILDRYRSIRSD
jgi:uncharacterized phiE125 gp8 family phage protein